MEVDEVTLHHIWGADADGLSVIQMCVRAFITFIAALILIRLAGRRAFSMKSPFDNTLAILLGGILARAVIGDVSYPAGLTACVILASMHRLFGYLSIRYKKFGSLVKGDKLTLYEHGKFNIANMHRSLLSENDIMERLRVRGYESLDNVKVAYMERNGEVSFINK
jgi:uncharacterized membrane protein YcaP (DUF421 family)